MLTDFKTTTDRASTGVLALLCMASVLKIARVAFLW